jgi:hypothetical protein
LTALLAKYIREHSLACEEVAQFSNLHLSLLITLQQLPEGNTSPSHSVQKQKQEAGFYFPAPDSKIEKGIWEGGYDEISDSIRRLHQTLMSSNSIPVFFEEVLRYDPVFVATLAEVYFVTKDLTELEENVGIYYALWESKIQTHSILVMLSVNDFQERELQAVARVGLSDELTSRADLQLMEELELYNDIPNEARLVDSLRRKGLLQRVMESQKT